MISAILEGKALQVFDRAVNTQFVTTAYTVNEVRFWIENDARRGGDRDAHEKTLGYLPLTVYEPDAYQAALAEARQRMPDPNDVDLTALALLLGSPVWSNDSDFEKAGIECYPTGLLLRALESTQP